MKIALVTGGSRGLGKSISLHIAAKGNDVVLTYNRKKADAEEVVKEIENTGRKAAALELDLSDSTSFDAFVENLRGVLQAKWKRKDFDVLVNNAGVGIGAPFASTTEPRRTATNNNSPVTFGSIGRSRRPSITTKYSGHSASSPSLWKDSRLPSSRVVSDSL